MTTGSDTASTTQQTTKTTATQKEFTDLLRADLDRCRESRLHLLVTGILTVVLGVTAVSVMGFAGAFNTQATLSGFVQTLTINTAWFFFSLFALIGLFIAYPAHSDRGTLGSSKQTLAGTLASRWLLVSVAATVAFILPFVIGLLIFDDFSVLAFLGVVGLTALTLSAYTSIGVSLAAVVDAQTRLVFWLLAVYWVLIFLWETSVMPLVIAIGVTGEGVGAIGTPPTVHDALLTLSPGGAHASLSNAFLGSEFGVVELVAAGALLGWLVLPPALAYAFSED